ncbi:MAG: manganese efflux pump [Oscillospiraceae bacterium]|nr:manganese efflux pump [Oscillospiraceae bacterium]
MRFAELFLIAVGLSMDAFAVSVCKGLSVKSLQARHILLVGLYFGGFQFLMPLLGWLLGYRFETMIASFDHWIAFGLLAIIGINMIQESFGEGEKLDDDFGVRTMLMLAVATSIDALAVGVTFAFLSVRVVPAAALIGVTTFVLSGVGIYVGRAFGARYKNRAERLGGVILILIGLKILLEHLGLLPF